MQLPVITLMLVLLSACGHVHSTIEVPPNREFDLKFQESVSIQKEEITIEFYSLLQDSRCPKGAQCITQGNAMIELHIKKAQQEATTVQLNTDSGAKEARFEKYKITLVALNPYPVSGKEFDPSDYIATLVITTV